MVTNKLVTIGNVLILDIVSCLYARPVKVVSVNNKRKKQSFLLFIKFLMYANYKLPMFRKNFLKLKFWELRSTS